MPLPQAPIPERNEVDPTLQTIGYAVALQEGVGVDTIDQHSETYMRNLEALEGKGELGDFFSILYKRAVDVEPSLENTVITTAGADSDNTLRYTGGYALHKDMTESGVYEVVVNTDDGLAHYEHLLRNRRESVEHNFQQLGIPPEQAIAKALAGFIFLHELGHIVDFMKNAPDLASYMKRRNADMESLPIPKHNPATLLEFLQSDVGIAWYMKARLALEKRYGVTTTGDLVVIQGKSYRELETERIPDAFAAQILRPFL